MGFGGQGTSLKSYFAGRKKMTTIERKELLEILVLNYLYAKEQNIVFQRENDNSYAIALGKLQGVCMALNLDFEETENNVMVFTNSKKKIVTKIEKM